MSNFNATIKTKTPVRGKLNTIQESIEATDIHDASAKIHSKYPKACETQIKGGPKERRTTIIETENNA